MKSRCKNCKYWRGTEIWGGRDCRNYKLKAIPLTSPPDQYGIDIAYKADAIITEPEFGCVQFVPK